MKRVVPELASEPPSKLQRVAADSPVPRDAADAGARLGSPAVPLFIDAIAQPLLPAFPEGFLPTRTVESSLEGTCVEDAAREAMPECVRVAESLPGPRDAAVALALLFSPARASGLRGAADASLAAPADSRAPWLDFLWHAAVGLRATTSRSRAIVVAAPAARAFQAGEFTRGRGLVWPGFASCWATESAALNSLKASERDLCVFFTIDGADVARPWGSEGEHVLMPASEFEVTGAMDFRGLRLVNLRPRPPQPSGGFLPTARWACTRGARQWSEGALGPALALFQQALALDDTYVAARLALCYLHHQQPFTTGAEGRDTVLEGYIDSVQTCSRAALEEARSLVRELASQSCPAGLLLWGGLLAEGAGREPKDEAEALRLWRAASNQGFVPAHFAMAGAYYNGDGAPADKREAGRLLALAAAQGHAVARLGLGFMRGVGDGVEASTAERARLYVQAAGQGVASAMFRLGLLRARGEGVPQDTREAVSLLRRAIAQGVSEASSDYARFQAR